MNRISATQLAAAAFAAMSAHAQTQTQTQTQIQMQPVERPNVKVGDSWIYRDTTEVGQGGWKQTRDEFRVIRVTQTTFYLQSRQADSTQPPRDLLVNADWSRVRSVNGHETVVNQPLAFPLEAGKTWTIHYREDHPNKAHRFEEWTTHYTVVGPEPVEVPAGKFNAIKIEAEGNWTAELEPASSVVQATTSAGGSVSTAAEVKQVRALPFEGRTYKALWFVPEVHRWVKSVEEYYGSNGVRNERYTSELETFKPGP